jgi:nitroreductase
MRTKRVEYLERVHETWRHHDLVGSHDAVGLVQYAVMAASSHNTQPWKFKVESGRVRIFPDFSRRCPEVDPDDHHLYVSLGCAAENLLWAARAAGLEGRVSCDPSRPSLQVDFDAAPAARSELFEAIPRRQCSRTQYDGSQISSEALRRLEEAGRGSGVSVLLLTDAKAREQVADYVAAGNAAQFGDPRWAREMKKWIRFNARDAARTGDGLYGAVLGIPDVPRWLGERSMRWAASAKSQNRKDHAHLQSSAAIAVFCSEADDWQHWAEAGRSYERFALQATALGLKTAFINQPVEVPAVRAQFASYLGLGHRRPDLLVRIGRGPESPRSMRRPVDDVLL